MSDLKGRLDTGFSRLWTELTNDWQRFRGGTPDYNFADMRNKDQLRLRERYEREAKNIQLKRTLAKRTGTAVAPSVTLNRA